MSDLTGKTIAETYRDLLQIAASSTGGGLDSTPRTVQDGSGNNSALQLSNDTVNINGTLELGGTAITKTAEQINSIADISTLTGIAAGDAGTIYGRTLSASVGISISNADGTAGNPTFSLAATSVSAGTYAGQTTSFDVDATGRITGTNTTDTVSVGNVNTVNLSATTVNISGNTSIGGTLTMSGALAVASLSVTGDIHGNNVNVSAIDAASITVSGIVSATSFAGSGAALTSIVAASATNASYAASAGEAAVAVSANHATSANTALFASSATNATNAVSAVFASSATNATNAVSAVFANSATNATNAINVDYGGVVETSSANLGSVSASDMFVSGPVSVGGTFDVSGAVSIGGGLFVVGDVSAGNVYAGGIIYGNGAGLFNVPSEQGGTVNFVEAGTGIHVLIDGTTTTDPITGSGTLALNADQSFGTVSATSLIISGDNVAMSATVASLSATMATSIDNTNTNLTALSATMATSIDNTNTNVTALSATMATSIDNTNSNLTALSATMATSIDNSNTNITANANAITSINSVIAGVSSTLATSINNTNSNVTALSATMATSIANHLPLAGGTLTGNLILNGAPSANLQAATKQYVDNLTAAAIHFHDSVRVESPDSAGNLNATYDNGTDGVGATLTNAGTQAALVIDGVTLNTSDRVLIYAQTDATQNGVYTVTDTGSVSTNWILTRATDADSYEPTTADGLDGGSYFYVQEGDTGAGEAYVCNNTGTITFGTTDITFVQFSSALVYTAGSGININGSRVISVSGVPTDADLTVLSATMATSINNTNTNVTALSATFATSINNSNTNITTNTNAITSINSKIATVSGALATSIGNSNSAITALSATLATSIANQATDARLDAVSAALATSINNSNTNITTNTNAITSINSKIATVSSTLATSISTVNTRITSLSATFATSIGNQATDARVDALSATFATSIANQNQTITAGSGLTGGGSGNVTLNVGAGTGISVAADSVGLATAGAGAGTYGSTDNATKIDTITLDAYGRVTGVATGGTGDIDGVTAGNGLTGGGTSGTVTLNVGAGTGVTVNANDIAIGQAVGTGNSVTFAGVNINGNLNAVDDIYLADQILHEGDTDTYMQFHAANQWRVVTGGTEMLEVNDSYVLLGANSVGSVETATKTGSVTPNLYVYNSFVWTLTGNITLNNPTTEVAGQSGVFIFIHSGAARTVSLGTDYETVGGAGLTLSSTAGATDVVPYTVSASGRILLGTPQLAFS